MFKNKYGINCLMAIECGKYMFYNSIDKINEIRSSKKIIGINTEEYFVLRDIIDDFIDGQLNRSINYIQALSVLSLDRAMFESIIIEAAVSSKKAGYDIDESLLNKNIFDELMKPQRAVVERPHF